MAAASIPEREGPHGHSPHQRIRMPQKKRWAGGDSTWMSTNPASRVKLGSGNINPSRSPSIRSKSKTILPSSSVCPIDWAIRSTISPSIVNSRRANDEKRQQEERRQGPWIDHHENDHHHRHRHHHQKYRSTPSPLLMQHRSSSTMCSRSLHSTDYQ